MSVRIPTCVGIISQQVPRLTYTYPYTGVPVGTTEFILVLRIFYLYYRVYSRISDLIMVLRSIYNVFRILYMYYRTYTCISDLTCILRNLYWSYRIYICVQDLFLSYRSYSGVTELILVFRILFFCEGTRRYDKSEQIRIIDSLYGSNRSYDWTYTYLDLP